MKAILQPKNRWRLVILLSVLCFCILAILPRSFYLHYFSLSFIRKYSPWVHMGSHAILALSICFFLFFKRIYSGYYLSSFIVLFVAGVLSMLFGFFTESLQLFVPEREWEWFDLYCDFMGTLIGLLGFLSFKLFHVGLHHWQQGHFKFWR